MHFFHPPPHVRRTRQHQGDEMASYRDQPPSPLGDALGRLAFFEGADPTLLAKAAPASRWIDVEAGKLILDFGDDTDDVFLVVDGALRVVIRTTLGQEIILSDMGPGELFGDVAAIDGSKRSASVVALRKTQLCRLPSETFLGLALNAPVVGLRLLRALTARLRREDERLFELTALPVRERLAAELLRLSRPRTGDRGRVISPPPPQHVIAARIGARRETVSLSLRSLVDENLIEVSSRAIGLPRPEALRAIIDARLHGVPIEGPGLIDSALRDNA
jgi:CRP/FNR family transcriptional regulator, cyclic AMP receptor protein